jgi:hypothetical protein
MFLYIVCWTSVHAPYLACLGQDDMSSQLLDLRFSKKLIQLSDDQVHQLSRIENDYKSLNEDSTWKQLSRKQKLSILDEFTKKAELVLSDTQRSTLMSFRSCRFRSPQDLLFLELLLKWNDPRMEPDQAEKLKALLENWYFVCVERTELIKDDSNDEKSKVLLDLWYKTKPDLFRAIESDLTDQQKSRFDQLQLQFKIATNGIGCLLDEAVGEPLHLTIEQKSKIRDLLKREQTLPRDLRKHPRDLLAEMYAMLSSEHRATFLQSLGAIHNDFIWIEQALNLK